MDMNNTMGRFIARLKSLVEQCVRTDLKEEVQFMRRLGDRSN